MNVFSLRNQIVNDYSAYISSFIQIRDQKIKEYVDLQLASGLLWPEALIKPLASELAINVKEESTPKEESPA